MKAWLWALTGFATILAGPAPAQPAQMAPLASQSSTAAITFNPPLGRPLRYRFARTRELNGQSRTTELFMTLEFSRSGDDFRLSVTMSLPPSLQGYASHPMIRQMLAPSVYRVTDQALIVALENEAEQWAFVDQVLNEMYANDATAANASRSMMRDMRALPAENRLAIVAANIYPLLNFAATELPIGEPVATSRPIETIAGAVTQIETVTVDRIDSGIVHASVTTGLSPSDARRVAEHMIERMEGHGVQRPQGPLDMEDAEIAAGSDLAIRHAYEVSAATGLTRRYTRTVTTDPGGSPLIDMELELVP